MKTWQYCVICAVMCRTYSVLEGLRKGSISVLQGVSKGFFEEDRFKTCNQMLERGVKRCKAKGWGVEELWLACPVPGTMLGTWGPHLYKGLPSSLLFPTLARILHVLSLSPLATIPDSCARSPQALSPIQCSDRPWTLFSVSPFFS